VTRALCLAWALQYADELRDLEVWSLGHRGFPVYSDWPTDVQDLADLRWGAEVPRNAPWVLINKRTRQILDSSHVITRSEVGT
jgi:hypothetical protein